MRAMRAEMTQEFADEPTPAQLRGTMVHAAILTPERFQASVAKWTGGRRAGAKWTAFKKANIGKTILTEEEAADLVAVRKVVFGNTRATTLLRHAPFREAVHEWTDPIYGRAKCRVDARASDGSYWIELKTTTAATRRAYASQHYTLGYDMQLGWYAHGLPDTARCHLIVVHLGRIPDVCCYHIGADLLEAGYNKAKAIAARYRACEAAGMFYGLNEGEDECVFEPPAWAGAGADWTVGDNNAGGMI
jgi:hypothetical protein